MLPTQPVIAASAAKPASQMPARWAPMRVSSASQLFSSTVATIARTTALHQPITAIQAGRLRKPGPMLCFAVARRLLTRRA